MNSGIYKILNTISCKFYVGSATEIKKRWREHKHYLKLNKHKNKFLQASWNLHGEEAFKFEVIELCNIEKLVEREQHWLDNTQCYDRNIGYNLNKIANSMLGFKHSEETKLKFKNRIYTNEIRANMSAGQKGKKYGPEHGEKISRLHTGKTVSEKAKERIGAFNRGKRLSEETKYLISAANKGRKISPEAIVKREASRLRNKQERLQHEY